MVQNSSLALRQPEQLFRLQLHILISELPKDGSALKDLHK